MSYDLAEQSLYAGAPYELYLFETTDTAWRLTSSDVNRTGPGGTYTAAPIKRTGFGKAAEQKSNSLTVTLPHDHAIAQLFVDYMPSTPLSLVVYRGHEGESETIVQFTGAVLSASFGEDCELNCVPEEYILRQKLPRTTYQTPCNKIIYSEACGVDCASFATTATLTAVDEDEVTAAEFAALGDGYFTNGYLEWGSHRRMVIRHVGSTLTLMTPISGLAAGESVTAYAGCPRTYATCVARFNNGAQFWGFEWIPGRNPFKGVEW